MTVESRHACAAVVAGDEALCASLVLLLQMCGLSTVGFTQPQELLDNARGDEEFIFIDSAMSGRSSLAELRRRGWNGIAVLMSDSEPPLDWDLPEETHAVLVKPFSSEDVLAILDNQKPR